jgi:diguanylate cyclase
VARTSTRRPHSTARLFVVFAVLTLIPVLVLGAVLSANYRDGASSRGLAQGASEALLMAQTAVQPQFDDIPLSDGLSPAETASMQHLVHDAIRSGTVLRFRLRDLAGHVVFSDDGSGFSERPEDEAIAAARGVEMARLTRFNSDSVDRGAVGPTSVEVYLPLRAGAPQRLIGVMEVYLPYAPIAADVDAGLSTLYRNLAIGLAVLYLVLFGISVFVGRRLRRQVRVNAYLAEHDALTDLPNRALFHRRVEDTLERGRDTGRSTVIAIIDLDRFKDINDTLGHHNGDRLLTTLSDRLCAHLRGMDALARLGGDEFGVVLGDVREPEAILGRLREVIEQEVELSGLPVSIEASVGYVVAPDHGDDVDELLQKADVAMYVAKAHHSGIVRYDPSHNHYDAANLALVSELRHAIDTDQLVLHYQPKVGLRDGRARALEALIRWDHPVHGLLPPDRFIPLAEQTGLIDRLTDWVVTRALGDVDALPGDLDVAVNVSARSLTGPRLVDRMVDELQRVGMAPERLIVEVTETALMTDPDRAALVLGRLHRAGVRVSIDDFGTGQTSLAYLSALPISELKIDRTFVTDMAVDGDKRAIVQSVVDLGHNLGFHVVGEGVETPAGAEALAATGCDVAQGYLYTRPLSPVALVDWLASHQPTPVTLA